MSHTIAYVCDACHTQFKWGHQVLTVVIDARMLDPMRHPAYEYGEPMAQVDICDDCASRTLVTATGRIVGPEELGAIVAKAIAYSSPEAIAIAS